MVLSTPNKALFYCIKFGAKTQSLGWPFAPKSTAVLILTL